MSDLPVVTELMQTCGACPSQWEGRTKDGRHVYIRYRWGWLSVGIGDDLNKAVGNKAALAQLGDAFDGTLSEDEMIQSASSVLSFEALKGGEL